jgi:hypothetical protein
VTLRRIATPRGYDDELASPLIRIIRNHAGLQPLVPHSIGALGQSPSCARFQAFSRDEATRPLPGEPHALPGTPDARLACRSTRWRESVPP